MSLIDRRFKLSWMLLFKQISLFRTAQLIRVVEFRLPVLVHSRRSLCSRHNDGPLTLHVLVDSRRDLTPQCVGHSH